MFKELPRTSKQGATRSRVLKVGINDAPYQTTIEVGGLKYTCPYYVRWVAMLTRCYSSRWLKAHPSYVGCSVVPEWHSFMKFKTWMNTQDWQGKQLDKDLLSLGSQIYSPDTCLFISPGINSLFIDGAPKEGSLPVGIYARKGKYEVGASLGTSKRVWVGSYTTIPDAIDAYIGAKTKAANTAIAQTKDTRVKQAITGYLHYFTDKLLLLKAGY